MVADGDGRAVDVVRPEQTGDAGQQGAGDTGRQCPGDGAAGPGGTGRSGSIGTAAVTGAVAMFAADTASRAAGIELVAVAAGRAEVRMTVRPDMANGHGIAHGGYVFLLADTAFACACNEAGSVTVAAGADITFLAPARTGDRLTAVAELRSRRGRSGVYDVTVTRRVAGCEETIAEFRGRSRTLPAPAPSHPEGHAR